MTPEELEKQRQQEQQKRDSFNKKLELLFFENLTERK